MKAVLGAWLLSPRKQRVAPSLIKPQAYELPTDTCVRGPSISNTSGCAVNSDLIAKLGTGEGADSGNGTGEKLHAVKQAATNIAGSNRLDANTYIRGISENYP